MYIDEAAYTHGLAGMLAYASVCAKLLLTPNFGKFFPMQRKTFPMAMYILNYASITYSSAK